jgi:DNA-binding transcriptional ArsR family regulator
MAGKRPQRRSVAKPDEQKPAQIRDKNVLDAAQQGGADTVSEITVSEAPRALMDEAANIFRLLSDQSRLRILLYVWQSGELNVTAICERLNQMQPAVSHHLALLRVSGAIQARRSGKNVFYTVRSELFNDLLIRLFSAFGTIPKKLKIHNFTMTYTGR